MVTATVTCSRCQNRIEISNLLQADLALICDSLAAENEKLKEQAADDANWRAEVTRKLTGSPEPISRGRALELVVERTKQPPEAAKGASDENDTGKPIV